MGVDTGFCTLGVQTYKTHGIRYNVTLIQTDI